MNRLKDKPLFILRNIKIKVIEYMIFNINYTYDPNVSIENLRENYKNIDYVFYQYLNFEIYNNTDNIPNNIKKDFIKPDNYEQDILEKIKNNNIFSLNEKEKKLYYLYLLKYVFSIYYEIISENGPIKRTIYNIFNYIKDNDKKLNDFDINPHLYIHPLLKPIYDKINY